MNSGDTHLFLIRHGEANCNVDRVIGGPKGDTGLTARGVRQAEALRDRLAHYPWPKGRSPEVFVASSLPRARQTAAIVAPGLGLTPTLDDAFQELRTGDAADGLALGEYVARFGWVDLGSEPEVPVDPGGESFASFHARVGGAFDRLLAAHAGRVIVVATHGGVVDASFVYFLGLNFDYTRRVAFGATHTSITHWAFLPRFAFGPESPAKSWRLIRYNDDLHAHGL